MIRRLRVVSSFVLAVTVCASLVLVIGLAGYGGEQLVIDSRVLFRDTPSVWVFGEVINVGSTAVKNVNVTVTFYDDQDNVVNQFTRRILFNVLMPQRRAPFSASIYDDEAVQYGTTGRYEASIACYEPSEDIETGIVVIPENASVTSDNVTVTGYLYNNGSSPLRIIQVVGLLYDEYGFRTYSDPFLYMLFSPLMPGEQTDEAFELFADSADNASGRLACIVTAEAPERVVGNTTQQASTVDQEVLLWLKGGNGFPRVHNLDTQRSYSTIQEAVDASDTLDGHTIFIEQGEYTEDVTVTKSLSVTGQDMSNTVLDGTLRVQADNVEVRRLCVQNGQGIWLEDVNECKITETTSRNSTNFGISLDNASNSTISFNTVYANYYDGIMTCHGGSNNTISSNHVEDCGRDGIAVEQSSSDRIENNTIVSVGTGLHIRYTNCSIVTGNTVIDTYLGIWTEHTSQNTFFHNNFMNYTDLATPDSLNTYDNGVEGNYWGNYTGVDSDNDGIGDAWQEIDEYNVDRYPLMAPTSIFDAGVWNGTQQRINVVSNSTITSFRLNATANKVSFNVTGETPSSGFCRITIPNIIAEQMWSHNYTILIDDEEPTLVKNWTDTTNTYIYLTHQHSTHEITIVPELTTHILVPVLALATIAAALAKANSKAKLKGTKTSIDQS